MPILNMKCIDSWKRLLPDYDLELWNEERFDVNMNQFTERSLSDEEVGVRFRLRQVIRLVSLRRYIHRH